MKNNTITIIGYLLITIYFLQYFLEVNWELIVEFQANPFYRKWTGLALFIFILSQWGLALFRSVLKFDKNRLLSYSKIHSWLGAISPIFFYIHTAKPGHAILLILTIIFFANSFIGLLNIKNGKLQSRWLYYIYIGSHIILSVSIMILSLIHIWIVFKFN